MNKPQAGNTLGSQRLLQIAVNRRPELLLSAIKDSGALGEQESIIWKSPLKTENFVEYRDKAALNKLEIGALLKVPLSNFWPARGAVWDGLGITNKGRPLLIEAKAHIPEAASPGTKATPKSRQLIDKSLTATRRHLAPKSKAIWTGTFYQYANRLAYQYYLRVLNNIESTLVFLDFTNATDMNGPATKEEWIGATRIIHAVLGIPQNLEHFGVFHAYINAQQLTDKPKTTEFTRTLDGKEFLKDANGNPIPLDKWENEPSDEMFELVQSMPEEEIDKLIKRLKI